MPQGPRIGHPARYPRGAGRQRAQNRQWVTRKVHAVHRFRRGHADGSLAGVRKEPRLARPKTQSQAPNLERPSVEPSGTSCEPRSDIRYAVTSLLQSCHLCMRSPGPYAWYFGFTRREQALAAEAPPVQLPFLQRAAPRCNARSRRPMWRPACRRHLSHVY